MMGSTGMATYLGVAPLPSLHRRRRLSPHGSQARCLAASARSHTPTPTPIPSLSSPSCAGKDGAVETSPIRDRSQRHYPVPAHAHLLLELSTQGHRNDAAPLPGDGAVGGESPDGKRTTGCHACWGYAADPSTQHA
ncbi:hypothetical protein AB1N83_009077 [Pleurotus pulmonarius]